MQPPVIPDMLDIWLCWIFGYAGYLVMDRYRIRQFRMAYLHFLFPEGRGGGAKGGDMRVTLYVDSGTAL